MIPVFISRPWILSLDSGLNIKTNDLRVLLTVSIPRVSKSCNHAITWFRKIFENLLKWKQNFKSGSIWHNLIRFFSSSFTCFLYNFYRMFLCQIFSQSNFIAQESLLLESLSISRFKFQKSPFQSWYQSSTVKSLNDSCDIHT